MGKIPPLRGFSLNAEKLNGAWGHLYMEKLIRDEISWKI